jgi:glutamate/tyrosine decarboxylase-like PLP-dependent enzyme
MNSLKFYLTLRVHGRTAYEELIDRQLGLARKAAAWFERSEHFEMATPQVLPILNFRLRGIPEEELAAAHARLVEEVTRDGQRWISQTYVNGCSVLRMMIISYLTTEEHVAQLQTALLQAVPSAKTVSAR